MATKRTTLQNDEILTKEQLEMLEAATKRPDSFDKDNPPLTDEQLEQFKRIHERNKGERRKQNVTLRLDPNTIKIAKSLGKGYSGILSRIVEDTLNDPEKLRMYL
jgi:uncharacterized protein (DUF4415 family)